MQYSGVRCYWITHEIRNGSIDRKLMLGQFYVLSKAIIYDLLESLACTFSIRNEHFDIKHTSFVECEIIQFIAAGASITCRLLRIHLLWIFNGNSSLRHHRDLSKWALPWGSKNVYNFFQNVFYFLPQINVRTVCVRINRCYVHYERNDIQRHKPTVQSNYSEYLISLDVLFWPNYIK